MTPLKIAQEYLQEHNDYVEALKALLNDLDSAFRRKDRTQCEFLCDAMLALQKLNSKSESKRR